MHQGGIINKHFQHKTLVSVFSCFDRYLICIQYSFLCVSQKEAFDTAFYSEREYDDNDENKDQSKDSTCLGFVGGLFVESENRN